MRRQAAPRGLGAKLKPRPAPPRRACAPQAANGFLPVVKVISGEGSVALAHLKDLVDKHARIVAQPVMSVAAFEDMQENAVPQFGYHMGKQRLTLQHPDLIEASLTDTPWGLFVADVFELVRGSLGCRLINSFININRGELVPTAGGGHDNARGFHVDNFSENPEPWPNMARLIFYWMPPGELGIICIRYEGAAIELSAPPGMGLLLSNVLLDLPACTASHQAPKWRRRDRPR